MSKLIQKIIAHAIALFVLGAPIVCALGANPPRWMFVVYLIVLAFVMNGSGRSPGEGKP